MLALLDFGYGFKSAPQHLPDQLQQDVAFTYYLFKPTAITPKGSELEIPDEPKELRFKWYGQIDSETGARIYKQEDVKLI